MLNQSEFWKPINSYELRIDEKKLITLGYPRNDVLFHDQIDLQSYFDTPFKKIVAWYPTYRQHQDYSPKRPYHGKTTIPFLYDVESVKRLNALAKKYGVLLVIKPHPCQDMSIIKNTTTDHIVIVNDHYFTDRKITSYEFLAGTDALITDYSSVVFDYLLTKKPIALAFEDYELYKEQVGFAIDMSIIQKCATMLNTIEDFEAFFHGLIIEDDPLREEREKLMKLTNQYLDANSSKRVVDWMETLLKR